MKYPLIFLLSILFTFHLSAQEAWQRQPGCTDQCLRTVSFADALHGWAAGDSGVIIHTVDGGENWIQQYSAITHRIAEVHFLDHNNGWAIAHDYENVPNGTLVLRTTNGGASWDIVNSGFAHIFLNCLYFTDELHGWAGASPCGIYRTYDGGMTWEAARIEQGIFTSYPVLDIRFLDKNIGYACGGIYNVAGVTWSTVNGGDNWFPINPSMAVDNELRSLHIADPLNVLCVGGSQPYGFAKLETHNGGMNWILDEPGIPGYALDVSFRNENEAWCPVAPGCNLIFSQDAGETWVQIPTPDSCAIMDICFPDQAHGYGVGRKGAIIRFDSTWFVGMQEPVLRENDLSFGLKCHPNPVRESALITYIVPEGGEVALSIYDMAGREMVMLVNGLTPDGAHPVLWNTSGIPSGFYFAVLRAGQRFETLKITVRH